MRSSRGSDIAFRQPRQPSLAELRAANLRRRHRMRDAQAMHKRGWRITFEAFDQLARNFDEDTVDRLLARFAAADPAVLKALAVDALPTSPPIRAVSG